MFRKLFLILSVFRFNLTNALSKVPNKYIINNALPECCNCKHFMPHNSEEHKYSLATCLLYGQKDIISGKIRFEFASHVRNSKEQCSKEGFNFEPIDEIVSPKN